jgi:hypothetical protein
LKIFKFYDHPQIRVQIEMMKTVMWYQVLTDSMKSFEERKDSKGKDTFDLSDWCKSNSETLSGFTYVTNLPKFCPSESVFSIFNVTYNDDQKKSHTGGMVEGVGVWYLFEIVLCLHVEDYSDIHLEIDLSVTNCSLLSHPFRNRLKCHFRV